MGTLPVSGQIDVTELEDRITALEQGQALLTARLDRLSFVPKIGVAVNTITSTYQAGWTKALSQFGPLAGLRWYSSGMPTSWPAPVSPLPALMLVSFKTDPATTASGSYDAAITAFAKTIPAGQYVTWQHESDQKAKNIVPATFGAGYDRVYDLIKAQQPKCFVAPVEQTFTFNDRTDTLGTSPWVTACDPKKIDYVGLDAYSSSPAWRSLHDEVEPSAAYVRKFVGNASLPIVLGEFNQAKATGRAQWFTDAGAYILNPLNRVALALLYDATYGIGYELTAADEIAAFAAVVAAAVPK